MMTRQGSDREIIPGVKPVFDALRSLEEGSFL